MRDLCSGLGFPEGPVAMGDGSVLVVEIKPGRITRVATDGTKTVLATPGGGPNGMAIGPDGAAYICNNGGFQWHDDGGAMRPGMQPADYSGGRIERLDLTTGELRVLYDRSDKAQLRGPNDIVFDAHGGFWFTDLGKSRARDMDRGSVCYALADGSMIREAIQPMITPNGIGLSPDGTELYVAETQTGRLWAFDVTAPGEVDLSRRSPMPPGRLVAGLPGLQLFDSLAVEASGAVCVATLIRGGITVISPQGEIVDFVEVPGEPFVTNVCFGGPAMRTAWITASGSGRLIEMEWPRPGLKLAWN